MGASLIVVSGGVDFHILWWFLQGGIVARLSPDALGLIGATSPCCWLWVIVWVMSGRVGVRRGDKPVGASLVVVSGGVDFHILWWFLRGGIVAWLSPDALGLIGATSPCFGWVIVWGMSGRVGVRRGDKPVGASLVVVSGGVDFHILWWLLQGGIVARLSPDALGLIGATKSCFCSG